MKKIALAIAFLVAATPSYAQFPNLKKKIERSENCLALVATFCA